MSAQAPEKNWIMEECDDNLDMEYVIKDDSDACTVQYLVSCTDTGKLPPAGRAVAVEPQEAYAYAKANTPRYYAGAPLRKVKLKQVENEFQCTFEATYETGSDKREEDGTLINPYVTVTTTGKTERRYYSKETRLQLLPSSGGPLSAEIDFKTGINVGDSGPEGVDVPTRNFTWTEKWYFRHGSVSWAYLQNIGNFTGIINATVFRGFEAQSVMFLGVEFSPENSGDYHIATFYFAYNRGGQDTWVNGFEPFDKKGWDYFWLYSVSVPDASGKVISRPAQLNVERVGVPMPFDTVLKIPAELPNSANIALTGDPVIAS